MPDLNFLPPRPLKPQSTLRAIRHINTALHIRLNIYEELPRHLRDYSVANGRATFTFPSEFEFDVTIADEDPSVQFYFVDLRFLSSPAPSLADGGLRDFLQYRADETLLASGIAGCADFLRNIVLTQKITIMEKQARRLLKGAWSSGVRVDLVQRRLVIQYWVDAPFPKSWIEVGLTSGESRKDVLPGEVALSSIETRWKRYGADVGDALKLDANVISAERLLRRALSSHISILLETTMTKLRDLAGPTSILGMDLLRSDDDPEACSLDLRLGRFSSEHQFSVEPYTGRLSLRPATLVSRNGEFDLNHAGPPSKNPMEYAAEKLEIYLCLEVLVRYEQRARDYGWESVSLPIPPQYLTNRLGVKCVRWVNFRPLGWENEGGGWLIALTVSLDGERWFAIEV
jgi:mediator of RNA polymerase II transcription subunit 14